MPVSQPVVLLTADAELAALAKAAVWEAGAAVQHLVWPGQLDALPDAPRVLIRGHDIGAEVADAVRRAWPSCAAVGVALGDQGGPGPSGDLVLPGAWRQLTRLVELAGSPPRRGRRLAVIGAHGGAGASCLAVALARRLGERGVARLAALNSAGAPVDALLGASPGLGAGAGRGLGWAQAAAAAGAGAALQPQLVAGIEVIGPAGPEEGVAAWQVLGALEAWEAQADGGHTVLDAGRAAPCGGWRCASWADGAVLVGRCDPAGVAAVAALAREIAPLGPAAAVALREVRGGLKLAEAARELGRDVVLKVGDERSLVAGLVHGLAPGDRSLGPLAAAAGELAQLLSPAEGAPPARRASRRERGEGAAPGVRPRRAPRARRPALPTFNPAAFAEEW